MTKTDAIALKIVNGALKRVKEKVEPFTYAVNMLEPVPLSDLPKLELLWWMGLPPMVNICFLIPQTF